VRAARVHTIRIQNGDEAFAGVTALKTDAARRAGSESEQS